MSPPVDSPENECENDLQQQQQTQEEQEQKETPFETPEFMTAWTDKQKADFAFQLLTTLPSYQLVQIVDRISPYIHRDILTQFPYEIGVYILSFLDVSSLIRASQVSRGWHAMSEEQSLWRNLFEGQGWGYDRKEIHQYLLNAPEEEDYHAGSSGNGALSGSSGGGALSGSGNSNSGNSSNSAGNAVKTLSPVPITRTSSPLIGKSKWSRIYNLKNKAINRQQQKEDELEAYHYDHNSDTRIINWQRLYRNRYMIEQQWLRGSCETKRFPPNDANPQSDLHTEGIYTIQFDKEKVVTGSRDRSIKIWDAVTGRCKQTLRGHTGSVLCLQYDKDTIVSGSSDATLIVADLESGMIKKKLVGHGDSVLSLRLVNSDQVISCSKDRSLRLWDKNTGDCLKILLGHHAPVNAVQWKDNRIVSGSGDRTIKIWDLDTGKCLKTLAAHVRGVACLEFDGDHIVSGSSDQTIKVWNAITGDCIYTLVGHTELVRTLQLDTTASRIISGCYNGHLKIWSLHEGRLIRDLGQATEGRVLNVKFDFAKILCCSNLNKIVIYDFAHDINTKFLL